MIFAKLSLNPALIFSSIFLYNKILFPFKRVKVFLAVYGQNYKYIEPERDGTFEAARIEMGY